jgi:hypothetical protein
MTNIKNLRDKKEAKDKKLNDDILNWPLSMYTKQKNSIHDIMGSEWFKTILDFWILQERQAIKDLKNVRFKDLQEFWRVQAKSQIAEKFVQFLNNLTKT